MRPLPMDVPFVFDEGCLRTRSIRPAAQAVTYACQMTIYPSDWQAGLRFAWHHQLCHIHRRAGITELIPQVPAAKSLMHKQVGVACFFLNLSWGEGSRHRRRGIYPRSLAALQQWESTAPHE